MKDLATVAKELGELPKLIYQDLLQDSLRALSGIAAPPLEGLSRAIARIFGDKPPNNIRTPPAGLTGPVALGFALAGDEAEVKSMYAKLLASSMDGHEVHRAFPAVIGQLSPREARLLRKLSTEHLALTLRGEGFDDDFEELPQAAWTLPHDFETSELRVGDEELVGLALSNLLRLQLVWEDQRLWTSWESAFEKRRQDGETNKELAVRLFPRLKDHDWILNRFQHGFVALTPFGKAFCSMCIPTDDEWTW